MFWTEIGNVVKIERAGMDGSDRRAVVNSSLGWPGGVAVDTISERVYWTDERLRSIGSATLDGNDIRVKYLGMGCYVKSILSSLTLQLNINSGILSYHENYCMNGASVAIKAGRHAKPNKP